MVLSTNNAKGYTIEEITLYAYDADIDKETNGIDISDLITEFSITESIFFLGLTMEMTIVDGVNIIEKFALSGNEKIKIKLSKFDKNLQQNTEIDLKFIITDYPLYAKSTNRKYQAYKIEAVTEHTFLNTLLSLSQYLSGSPSNMIKNIMTNNLFFDESKININDTSNVLYDYIIPNITPLEAVRMILRSTCDDNMSPIIAWETIKGFNISSYVNMIEQSIYKDRTYNVSKFTDTQSDEALKYLGEITSVLEFSSNLKMSKAEQAGMGAYASRMNNYDIYTKSFNETIYDITENTDFKYLSNHTSFSEQFKIKDFPLNKYYDSKEYFVITNNENSKNIPLGGNTYIQEKIKNSYLAQANHVTHLIKLNGDLEFNSGIIINLNIPNEVATTEPNDYFSGKYLVSTVTHEFKSTYTMQVKLQRDGQSIKLN